MNHEASEEFEFMLTYGLRIWEQRHRYVDNVLEQYGIRTVCDIGCNTGKFLKRLTYTEHYDILAGVDINEEVLVEAENLLRPNIFDLVKNNREKNLDISLYCGSVLEDIAELKYLNFQAITMIELIEHLHPEDIKRLETNLFEILEPELIIVTTPNADFNVFFPNWSSKRFRDPDHKFEWSRNEFREWAYKASALYGYDVSIDGVGFPKSGDLSKGPCSQIAIFRRLLKKNLFSVINNKEETKISKPRNLKQTALIKLLASKNKTLSEDEKFDRTLEGIKTAYNYLINLGLFECDPESYRNLVSLERIMRFRCLDDLFRGNWAEFMNILNKICAESQNMTLNKDKTYLYIDEEEDGRTSETSMNEEENNYRFPEEIIDQTNDHRKLILLI